MAASNPAGAAATTPKPWKSVEVLRFKFDNFDSLPSELNKSTRSKTVTCSNGHTWALSIRPGGETPRPVDEASEQKMISLYLINMGPGEVDVIPTFLIRNASSVVMEFGCPQHHFVAGDAYGKVNFVKRAAIEGNQNVLVDGALLVDVELRVNLGPNCFVPPNPHVEHMLALLENRERADIAFKVDGAKVYARKMILEVTAPTLFSLCSRCNKRSPVPIEGVIRPVFEILLRYIYAGSEPGEDEVAKWGSLIIDAANRYAVVGLKMAVESTVIRSVLIETSNVVAWLMFADAMSCPLIKEFAIAMVAARPKDFLSDGRLKASPALMHELLVAISDDDDRFGAAQPKSVSEMRKELHEKGLDVDGTKEMLIARLEGSNKRQRTW